MHKEFVEVIVKYTRQGRQMPLSILWNDGRTFNIDRVLDVRAAPSLKAGGQGMRYTCRINGKQTFLWLEEDKWFVEARD